MFCSCIYDVINKWYENDDDDSENVILLEDEIKHANLELDTPGPLPPLDTSKWNHPIYISAHPCVSLLDLDENQSLPLAKPIPFETDLFKGAVFFRMKEAPSKEDKLHSQYFKGRKRFYQVIVQGQFKEELNMNDIMIGDYYSKPMANIPRGRIGSAFMKMYERFMEVLSPGIVIDLVSPKPKILTSFGGVQTMRVDRLGEEPKLTGALGNIKEDTSLLLGTKFSGNIQKRRKYLSNPDKASKYTVNPNHVYSFELYDHSMDFGTYYQHILGGRKIDMVMSMNGQALAVALFTRDKRCIYKFPVWHERLIGDMLSKHDLSKANSERKEKFLEKRKRLLCAALILSRNKKAAKYGSPPIQYEVTLIDKFQDFGSMPKNLLSRSFRSWMIGLSTHGLDAIRELPELFEHYVKGEGVLMEEYNIFFGAKKFTYEITAKDMKRMKQNRTENYMVDRNFIVAALARYLKDKYEHDDCYTPMYHSSCQYVDYDNRQVLVRKCGSNNMYTKEEKYVPYDLLIGCDGLRSIVRETLIRRHNDFHCKVSDTFEDFKAVHVEKPATLSSKGGITFLPNVFKHCQGMLFSETESMLNIAVGCPRNKFQDLDEELKNDDYKVVAKYLRENFKAFELVDYNDFAKQWVGQRWNQTGVVHCNRYHSKAMSVIIMGDAAHATSPSLAMGMNTALRDAQVLHQLLNEHEDNLDIVLEEFSRARVKEGNSLTSLSSNLYCLDPTTQLLEIVHIFVRSILANIFPMTILPHPMTKVGLRDVTLSEVFDLGKRIGIIDKHLAINERIKRQFFEQSNGMTKPRDGKVIRIALKAVFAAAIISAIALVFVWIFVWRYDQNRNEPSVE
ncbi:FAD/NAD(P)-binding domain-containing protein [Chaetoceros tenuissimus]|uniref:FAD/NAD(P)-binding domain-containing protein n=1 Tax=Chaetoceros tenuissimus TaxID=426638 RepID=A0AAD3CK34_9STRA|nr:FAD/NAD(P)-binding domain-containing protein [Chaetoceros tenuissimus]